MSDRPLRIGVDLGGTKIEAVVVRLGAADPEILARVRVLTEADHGYDHILERTRALVVDVAKEAGVDVGATNVGVGMPGSVTAAALVKNSNTTILNGRPFRADLARALGKTDVAFANDANCFALAESVWGAARGARVSFGVIVGTGVGGGLVFDGRSWDGAQGIAGEWGHIPLEPTTGPACYCGRRGCVETFLSGPAIEAAFVALGGPKLPLREIDELAKEGDRIASKLLEGRWDLFGRALSYVVNIVDPDVIVLGGGVSNLDALYTEGVEALARWTFNDELLTRVVKNELGDSAGVLGAALLEGALAPSASPSLPDLPSTCEDGVMRLRRPGAARRIFTPLGLRFKAR